MGVGVLSPWHIAIFALVVLVVFGPKRLPDLGRSLGKGMREFKESISMHPSDTNEIAAPQTTVHAAATAATGEAMPADRDSV